MRNAGLSLVGLLQPMHRRMFRWDAECIGFRQAARGSFAARTGNSIDDDLEASE